MSLRSEVIRIVNELLGNSKKISELPAASALTGTEQVEVNQGGTSARTTAQDIANLGGGVGAVSSVFGRTGAVTAQSGDYGVAQVNGAAPLDSPTLTGSTTITTNSEIKIHTEGTGNGYFTTSDPVGSDYSGFEYVANGADHAGFAGVVSGGESVNLDFGVNSGIIHFLIDDTRSTPNGVVYGADYGSTFIERSLVDKGYVDSRTQKVVQVAASDETSALTTGTAKVTFRMPYAMTLTAVRASLTTSQYSGNILTVDINNNGTSVLSTKLTIDNMEETSTTAVTPPVISSASLSDDTEITIDIDQVGDGTATGLKITLIGT